MKLNKIFIFLGVLAIMSVLVYAATLTSQTVVSSCYDFDGGVVTNVSSVVFVKPLNGTFYTKLDTCASNFTLTEFACGTIVNATGNFTTLQIWSENCTCSGGACI